MEKRSRGRLPSTALLTQRPSPGGRSAARAAEWDKRLLAGASGVLSRCTWTPRAQVLAAGRAHRQRPGRPQPGVHLPADGGLPGGRRIGWPCPATASRRSSTTRAASRAPPPRGPTDRRDGQRELRLGKRARPCVQFTPALPLLMQGLADV